MILPNRNKISSQTRLTEKLPILDPIIFRFRTAGLYDYFDSDQKGVKKCVFQQNLATKLGIRASNRKLVLKLPVINGTRTSFTLTNQTSSQSQTQLKNLNSSTAILIHLGNPHSTLASKSFNTTTRHYLSDPPIKKKKEGTWY